MPALRTLYEEAADAKVPVMVHTGTSVFPGARSKFGNPLAVDDVAVDFPNLTIIMAHGGRPFWCEEAFFVIRRHRNVYFDIASIPPKRLLHYFPRLEEIADRTVTLKDLITRQQQTVPRSKASQTIVKMLQQQKMLENAGSS